MNRQRTGTPRLGGGFSKATPSASVHAKAVHCRSCFWHGLRMDADGPCPRCGDALIAGPLHVSTPRRAKAKSLGQFGVRSEDEEQRTNDALRRNREEAQGG
jgi:hypothetical protein